MAHWQSAVLLGAVVMAAVPRLTGAIGGATGGQAGGDGGDDSTASGITVVFPPGHEERFTISIGGGGVWFENSPVWFQVEGVVYSTEPTASMEQLTRVGPAVSSTGSDVWGSYTKLAMKWGPGGVLVTTAVKVYATSGIVTFSQEFPHGLVVNGTLDAKNGVASGFPAFRPSNLTGATEQRLWMGYNGWDCTDLYGCVSAQAQRVALGRWDHGTSVLPQGLEGSGPLMVTAFDGSVSAVLSASASFMASSQQLIPDASARHPGGKLIGKPNSFWGSGKKYAATADNVTLAQCQALCDKSDCAFFDFAPGWPRGTTCGATEELCHNCRIILPSATAKLQTSGENYTAYCVADAADKACAGSSSGAGILTYGLMGSIAAVDPGFQMEIVLSVGGGPNDAVRKWGDRLTTRYNKVNPEDKDFTTTHLGYDTDNGAFYYKNPEPNKTFAQTLLDVHAYAESVGIPYRHVQFDSWWYIKGVGGGTMSWSPGNNTFPNGIESFHKQTGWNITAHNRMWAADVVYAKQNGGAYDWYIEGDEAVPTDQRFWNDLMVNASEWGMYVYEQDWLFTEFVGTAKTLQSTTLAREWLMQMGAGAENANRVIQYCMLWPRFALQSLEIPSVTTARGSTDYAPGHNDQWIMGLSSLFLDSLALRPTKDNYFSTDSQGHGEKGVEQFNRLQALVSTLSTGPVFPSDAINCSDPALILRSCMSDGRLLRPDRAATNLDNNILAKAVARADGTPEPGELETTTTTVGTWTYTYVLAANLNATTIAVDALFAPSHPATTAFVAFESNSSSHPVRFDAAHPLQLPAGDRWSFQYVTVAPVLANGYVFLGEAATKWMAVSRQRFSAITPTANGVTVAVAGAPGELVNIAYTRVSAGGAPAPTTYVECKIPVGGSTTINIGVDPSRQV